MTVLSLSERPQQPNAGVWAICGVLSMQISATYGVLQYADGRFKIVVVSTIGIEYIIVVVVVVVVVVVIVVVVVVVVVVCVVVGYSICQSIFCKRHEREI